jgi:uncharacterized protein (TIGR02391 family)
MLMTLNDPWDMIDKEIAGAARAIAEIGQYDAAIFQAFKHIEAVIQERIGSKSIGTSLIREAFAVSPPKILISTDARDQKSICDTFLGAMGNARNDRGHKKKPYVPCKTAETCWQYLSFASLLMYLLSRDRNCFPVIVSTEVFGSYDHPRVEIRGKNFGKTPRVLGKESAAFPIMAAYPGLLQVILPPRYRGEVRVAVSDDQSDPGYCDSQTLDDTTENTYEIIETEIPLYEDSSCTKQRLNVVGMRVQAVEGNKQFVRIMPVRPNAYSAGYYIAHGPYTSESVQESWFRHSRTGEAIYAWSSSLIAAPKVICKASGSVQFGGMTILPIKIKCQRGEPRILRVIAWGTDGEIRKEEDITDKVQWTSMDEKVAYVKHGVLYPKTNGRAEIRCSHEKLSAAAQAEVSHCAHGDTAIVLQGVRNITKVRCDPTDNLYFCNQGAGIFRIARDGHDGLKEVIRITQPETWSGGIGAFAVGRDKSIYLVDADGRQCVKYGYHERRGYGNHEVFAKRADGSSMGIAVDDAGVAYVVGASSWNKGYMIIRRDDGSETTVELKGFGTQVAVDHNGQVYVALNDNRSIDVYDNNGQFSRRLEHRTRDAVADMLIEESGHMLMACFYAGKILRFNLASFSDEPEVVATGMGTVGGIALDAQERLYVASFSANVKASCIVMMY